MCAACATRRPARSKRAQEWSLRSLMFGEYAVRSSVTPISSATEVNRCRKISSATGSRKITDIPGYPSACRPAEGSRRKRERAKGRREGAKGTEEPKETRRHGDTER